MSQLAPGPRGHWLLGSLPERRRDPFGLFMRSVEQYGDVVRFRMGPKRVFLINDPAHVKRVLMDNRDNYYRGMGYDELGPLLGDGLLRSEGGHWRKQRRLAQPAFHRERIAALATPMLEATDAMLERWEKHPQGKPLDVAHEMMRLTLSVVSRTLLGMDVSDEASEVGQALTELLVEANRRLLSAVHVREKLPLPSNLRFKRNVATLDRVVYRMIEERRRSGAPERHDLLALFMAARDEETGEGMSDRELRDEVMTIFLAGHETTANALSWAFYLLSKNPAAERRLKSEVDEALGGRAPSIEDLSKLRYAAGIFQESIRLYPPVWIMPRNVRADDTIGGFAIPKGSIVLMSQYLLHRHPKYWDNPEGFDPERFLSEKERENPLQPYCYFPFGAGPHRCIGAGFAAVEAQIILARVIQRFRLDLDSTHRVEPEPYYTLRPKNGMWMRVMKRGEPV